ncbi:MAG: hypothetical protein H7235_02985, partial [Bdellovibrionaceae bacterium]|nr:hypothetical protein [Pseudobdellovibrionaceae bacterium]
MLEDPVVSAAIKNAAPDLFFRLQDQLQKDRLDPELSASLFNITNRMTHRSVPNATYAGVSLGKIVATESSEILFHPQREYQIQRVIKKLELSRTSKKTKFILNPTAQFIHGVARFIPPLTPDDRKYKHSYVQLNHKLITYLEKKPNSLPFEIKMQLQQL